MGTVCYDFLKKNEKNIARIILRIIFRSNELLDMNECTNGGHVCYGSAACTDTDGSFYCTCYSGYTGDGNSCEG